MTELSFHPPLPFTVFFPIIIIITLLFLWLEWKKKQPRLILRLVLILTMMISLIAILLQPSYQKEASDEALLLTPGFDIHQADSLLKLNPRLHTLVMANTKDDESAPPIQSTHELSQLPFNMKYILGDGLPYYAWDSLSPRSFVFLPRKTVPGIHAVYLPEKVIVGHTTQVQGSYHVVSPPVKLILQGPGGSEDSISLTTPGLHSFNLHFYPKQQGVFTYKLLTKDSTSTKHEDTVPVQVLEEKMMNILFIQQFPTFETQYLKSYLGRKHKVRLRYQVSKNLFRYEAVNSPVERFDRLDLSRLKNFDLVFIDTDSWKTLSGAERVAVEQSVEQGMGLFILLNEDPSSIRELRPLLNLSFQKAKSDTSIITLDHHNITLPRWPYAPKPIPALTVLRKQHDEILSGYLSRGFGKIGFQLLQETYSVTLKGDSIGYSLLWSPVIEKIARAARAETSVMVKTTQPIYVNEPVDIDVLTTIQSPSLFLDSVRIPLTEDGNIDGLWHGRTWPLSTGWHPIKTSHDSVEDYLYVHPASSLQSVRAIQSINETKAFQNLTNSKGTATAASMVEEPLQLTLFYIAFLLSAAALWVLPKL
jgi:hypothetical protein